MTMMILLVLTSAAIAGVSTENLDTTDGETMIVGKQRYFLNMKNSVPLTQASAAVYCAGLNMELPDMATEAKQRALDLAIKGKNFTDNKRSRTFWTSGLRGSDGGWTWTNLDKAVTYVNWRDGEPGPGLDSIYFDTFLSVWYGARSDFVLYDVVCQTPRKCY